MSPPETSEKIEAVSPSLTPKAVSTGIDEHPVPGKKNLHLVERTGNEEGLVQYDDSDSISGFDAALMGARVALSNVEEKKLIRRIDWRLIPLLSLMYMLKSVDYSNVCFSILGSYKASIYCVIRFQTRVSWIKELRIISSLNFI